MRLLLDTHAAVWSVSSSHRLPPRIIDLLADPGNEVFVSVVSLWEIALKGTTGTHDPMPFSSAEGASRFTELGYTSLGLLPAHVFRVEHLEPHHRDPFDRLLIAQSLVEQLTIVSQDRSFPSYAAELISF